MFEKNKVHNVDCFELMSTLENESVDMILTDPPYLATNLSFDKLNLDFDKLFSEFERILKPNGWFFMFGILGMYKLASDYFREKFTYIWLKHNIVFSPDIVGPYKKHEYIFAFIKKDVKVSNLTLNRSELRKYGEKYYSSNQTSRKRNGDESTSGLGVPKNNVPKSGNYREGTTILEYPSKNGFPIEERTSHPTQKPLDLLDVLVRGYSNKNDLIFEPFAGSGSTLVAAKKNERDFLACEINSEYVKICEDRLNDPNQFNSNKLF